jgi:vacuolar-type H+-ATPase subunit H
VARESRKEAAKARQESAKVISDTREKASQIIAEIIERGSKQAQSESARAVSEARNRTSELLTQVSKSFEEIISQAERRVKSELKGLATLMAEAQTRLQPLIETSDNKAEESSQQATGEVVTATDSGDQKAESALLSTADKGTAAVKASNDTRLFKGRLKLEMIPPFDQEELECVPEWLPRLPSLRVMSTGGYAQANRWITTYTVDLEKPLPLFKILKAVPAVKEVTEDKGNIVVTMR